MPSAYSLLSDKYKEQARNAKKAYRLRNLEKCREQNRLQWRFMVEVKRLRNIEII